MMWKVVTCERSHFITAQSKQQALVCMNSIDPRRTVVSVELCGKDA
jgi:hypothetical protein